MAPDEVAVAVAIMVDLLAAVDSAFVQNVGRKFHIKEAKNARILNVPPVEEQ